MGCVIAIDGPAASGKSSVSRGVALALDFLFVSSGHFYRALAWGAVRDNPGREGVNDWVGERTLETEESGNSLRLRLDGEDATPHLSDPEVTAMVSLISAYPRVRDFVNDLLRTLATNHDLVMEGRDIGSVVFPDTTFKFYLDASPEERARRRAREGTIDQISERDRLDSTRAASPLVISQGAHVIDTTHLTLNEVIAAVLKRLEELHLQRSR
jgi:CMP/dCMP kinase